MVVKFLLKDIVIISYFMIKTPSLLEFGYLVIVIT